MNPIKIITTLINWVFDKPQYGYMTYDRTGLYRRHYRSRKIDMKTEFEWRPVNIHLGWKFRPHFEPSQSIMMPDGKPVYYSSKRRDEIGEREFDLWIQSQRRIILEQMIRAKYK